MINSIKLLIVNILLLLFTACGSSDFTKDISFGGVVVDGYIRGATVCLDLNRDSVCNNSEPATTSDENGKFGFASTYFDGYSYIPLIAKGGTDTATNKAFQGELKNIIDTSKLSEDNTIIINPLTDLVAVSYLRAEIDDNASLSDSVDEVAKVFNLSNADVLGDPMQNATLFVKVQEIQNLKRLIQTSAVKTYMAESGKNLLHEIKEALVTQIKDSTDGNLNLQRVLDTVEIQLNMSIPENEKTFIVSQVAEIKSALDVFATDTTIDLQNLDRLQLALENSLEVAYTRLKNTRETNTTIELLDINITYASITQSIFDKTDGILDEQACLQTNGYQMIADDSYDSGREIDTNNGIYIESKYSNTLEINATEVQIYYTDLNVQKQEHNTIVYKDDYTFAFDEAWVDNTKHTIYIRIPKDTNDLYGCYRAELNSTTANEITFTKVYRFLDIQ